MKRISRVALAAAALAIAIPLSGCAAMLSQQQTAAYEYNGGDGASADHDDVALRGLMLVANEDGEASLIFTVVNNSKDSATVEISVGGTDVRETIPAGEVLAQAPQAEGFTPITVTGLQAERGSLVDVEVTINGEAQTVRAQVLGALPEYEEALPTGGAEEPTTGTETATDDADGTAAASEDATTAS